MPIPLRCDRTPHVGLRHRATEAFNIERGVQCLSRHWLARNVGLSTSSRRATSATAASGRWRCATTTARSTPTRPSAASRRGRRTSGATPTSCRSRSRPSTRCRPAARRWCARRGWPRRSGCATSGSRTTRPTRPTRSRTGSSSIALAKAQELGYTTVACASTGNLANAVAAHAAAAGLDSYVFIPADLEEQKILATGVYGTKLVTVRGNYDDVNRLCTELSADRDWAFVNVNVRPYYAEGSKTLAFEIAEGLGFELPDRVVAPVASGSLFTKIARGFDEWRRGRADRRRDADDERRPGRGLLAGRAGVRRRLGHLQAGEAGHDRQVARHRQPGRRSLRARAGAPQRRLDRRGHRRRDPRRHPPARRDDRRLHRDRRRRRPRRRSRSWRRAATSIRTSGSSRSSPARA